MMGGAALKNTYTRRYERKEFLDILLEVRTLLENRGIVSEVPQWYSNKETFGDLDVLINSSTVNDNILDIIREVFNPNEIHNNSHVKSFDYKEFQIDFILVSDKNWNTSINYFSFNDLGNFIGRISYQMGFRFGDYGLKLVYRHEDGGRKFERIISTDSRKIYEFLGFDYERYVDGFDDVEDIFKYVVHSKYFNREIFKYENLNHQNKTRNKKRKNYELFLTYVLESPDVLPFDYEYKSKDYYVNKAENFFGINLEEDISKWRKEVAVQKNASAKFNGNVIMEKHPFLKGKELGESIKTLKNHIEDEELNYQNWINNTDLDDIFLMFNKVNNLSVKNKKQFKFK